MAETFNIELEADLSEFDREVGDLSWSAAAALAGTSGGLLCLIDDTTDIYGEKDFVQLATAVCRFRVYVDPNSLTMASADTFQIVRLVEGTAGRVQLWLRYDGSSYEIRARAMNDAGTWENTALWDVSDEPHFIEVQLSYASGAAASDATIDLWIDIVHKEQVTGLDIYDRSKPDAVRLGAVSDVDGGTSGTFYLDEFVLRNDDTEIGAVGGETPPVVVQGDGAPYFDGTLGVPPGSRGMCAINLGAMTENYVRGGQYFVQSLEWPKGSGTCLTYKEFCAQLQANNVNLLRVRLDGDNHSSGPGYGKFAFEPPPYGTYNCYHNVLDPDTLVTYRTDQGTGTWGGNWDGSNLERLINACGSYDVRLWIAPFHWFEFLKHWTYHAWNASNRYLNGVSCEVADQGFLTGSYGTGIFTNGTAITAAKARIQTLIDNVGTGSVVAAWEIFAELPYMGVPTYWGEVWGSAQRTNIRTKIVPWVQEICAYIGNADPGRPLAVTVIRTPGDAAWSGTSSNYWNVINEPCVATAAIKFVGVNCYTDGDYDEAVRIFRLAQEYVGTANDKVVFIDQYEGSDNGHPPNASEPAPYKPSKAIQWIGVCGAKWGLGAMRWIGFTETAPNVWIDGSLGDSNLAAVAGISATFAQYVNWYGHRVDWQQRHGQITSAGLDSCVAGGNTQYVTLFAKWSTAGSKTLAVSGLANGAYTFHIFDWLTGEHSSEQDVTVTTSAASIPMSVTQSENRLVAYLEPKSTTGSATMARDLSVTMGVTVTTSKPVTDTTVVASDAETRYELRVRQANGSEVARLGVGQADPDGNHVGAFQYSKHVNSPGGMTWRLSGSHPVLDLLEENGQIEVWRNAGGGWYRDFTAIWQADYDYEYRGKLDFVGYAPGPLSIVDWSTVAWAAGSANRSKFTGVVAETVAKSLVQYNVTSDAGTANGRDLDWRGPFTVTVESDRGLGSSLDVSCARQPLLETLQDVSAGGGGDFDMVRSATDPLSWQFRWYPGQRGSDRTDDVRFAIELANMHNVTYRHRGSRAQTAAIVGGRGEGKGREIEVRLATSDSSTRHRESFVQATEIERGETDALQDKGDRALTENADTEVFSFEIAQTPSSKYGVHYCIKGDLGDLVSVVRPNDGEVQTHKITEVTVAVHANGQDSVTVGLEQQ